VGNLATGGTGKTPMTEYLIRLLKNELKTATLSRGYKRKTRGFAIADQNTTALEIGDEPMQFHKKFPDIIVAVGEERLEAIPHLLHHQPAPQVIILDDAFQHRQVRAGLNILLTDHANLYTRDQMLPSGDLRDVRSSSKRAEIIIVTKCKPALSETEKRSVTSEIDPAANQSVYFTTIVYSNPYHLFNKEEISIAKDISVLLVCGIARPEPLKEYLSSHVADHEIMRYADHHIFNSDDLRDIKQQFEKMKGAKKIILSTEKDGVRLAKFESELKDHPVYMLPIEHSFLFNDAGEFENKVKAFIQSFQ